MLGGESMTSLLSESVATPASAEHAAVPGSFFSHLATQVRSWVASSSHPKAAPQPAIAGVDDTFHFSKGSAYLSDDELVHFASPVAKFKWNSSPEQDLESSDEEDNEYDYGSSCSPRSRLTSPAEKTPTPHQYAYPTDSESSSSILDILVEEFHPAFEYRGRSMVRCDS